MTTIQRNIIKKKPALSSDIQSKKMDEGINDDSEIIFRVLKQIADAFVSTFPRTSEVVVHDLSQPQQSIKHIAGDITHRKIGGPVTDLVIKALHQEGRNIRDRHNYKTTNSDGRVLKSTTVFIRNSIEDVVAALCINFDITDFLNAAYALDIFTSTENSLNGSEKAETFAKSISETIEALLQQAIVKIGKQPSSMSIEEKIELVKELEISGVFQIKGGIDQAALFMGVSKYTVYNYLKKIRAEHDLNRF
jgi:predicted transcriptional regulator YheO